VRKGLGSEVVDIHVLPQKGGVGRSEDVVVHQVAETRERRCGGPSHEEIMDETCILHLPVSGHAQKRENDF